MNKPTTAEMRETAEAATSGPWIHFIGENGICDVLPACRPGTVAASLTRPDAMYIAATNPKAIIELLDRLEAAEQEIDSLEEHSYSLEWPR